MPLPCGSNAGVNPQLSFNATRPANFMAACSLVRGIQQIVNAIGSPREMEAKMGCMRVPLIIAVLSSAIPNLYFIFVTLVVFVSTLVLCGQKLHIYIYIYSVARSFEVENLLQSMRGPTRDLLYMANTRDNSKPACTLADPRKLDKQTYITKKGSTFADLI